MSTATQTAPRHRAQMDTVTAGRDRPVPGLSWALTWRVLRGDRAALTATALPVTAVAVVATVVLTVAAGARTLVELADRTDEIYQWLAAIALALLVVPVASLCAAAARLCARRRDDALSTLRLLGAPRSVLVAMTTLESLLLSAVGIAIGVLGHLALTPLIGSLEFGGRTVTATDAWVGRDPELLLACVLGLLLLAAGSSLLGLRSVAVTPLGVVQRARAGTTRWVRLLALVIGLPVLVLVAQSSSQAPGLGMFTLGLVIVCVGGMSVLDLVGPVVLRVVARVQWRRARSVSRLLAARTVLDAPGTAWRRVSGAAVATFVAVLTGAGLSVVEDVEQAAPDDPYATLLISDIRTGVVLTVAFTFVLVACGIGVTQAAEVLDRRRLYVGLDRLGVPRRTMASARSRAVLAPLWLVVLVATGCALVLIAPFADEALFAGTTLWAIAVAVLVGVLLVRLAVAASGPLLRRVLDAPARSAD